VLSLSCGCAPCHSKANGPLAGILPWTTAATAAATTGFLMATLHY